VVSLLAVKHNCLRQIPTMLVFGINLPDSGCYLASQQPSCVIRVANPTGINGNGRFTGKTKAIYKERKINNKPDFNGGRL
jgi:hypothetical protein